MSERPKPGSAGLPLSAARRVDEICDRFEDALKAGQQPQIEAYLGNEAEPGYSVLLRELLGLDLHYRGRSGDSPSAEKYLALFPQHRELITALFPQEDAPDPQRMESTVEPEAGSETEPPGFSAASAAGGTVGDILGGTASPSEDAAPESVSTKTWTDRNLLFGLLALQVGFISGEALVAATCAWAMAKSKPLGLILQEQGALSAETHGLLEALVKKHLEVHGGDTHKSLALVGATGAARRDLQQLGDPDLAESLASLAEARETEELPPLRTLPEQGGTVAAPTGQRFRILRWHARGGLGEVYVANDQELDREVALKEMQERYAFHPESRARFLLEAMITAGLEHPGIVPVYGLGAYPDGRPYYAMRFIRGEGLDRAITRFHQVGGGYSGRSSLELRKLLGRFVDACNAVAYAHSRGVLHRDIKPSNIMLGNYGETLVVDWGLAKTIGRPEWAESQSADDTLRPVAAGTTTPTQVGSFVGTPPYTSPEQAAGDLERLGPASDVYSLGATLYCLLTGRPPFAEKDLSALLGKIRDGDFPTPRQVTPGVPEALEAVCLKAMARAPADRYSSATALAEAVQQWLASEADLQRARAEEQEALARHCLYVAHMNLAQRAWHTNQIPLMLELLERHRPQGPSDRDLRGFEWHYLWRIGHPRIRTMVGHGNKVWDVAVSPDGQWLASAGEDCTVRVWEVSTGREVLRLEEHIRPIACVAFADGAGQLLSASRDGTVRMWDVQTGQDVRCLVKDSQFFRPSRPVAFSPDGSQFASTRTQYGSTGTHRDVVAEQVTLWDTRTGQQALCLLPLKGRITCLAFNPSGTDLAIAILYLAPPHQFQASMHRYAIEVVDVRSGRECLSLSGEHVGAIRGLAFRPDGKYLASASDDATVKVWDLRTGRVTRSLKAEEREFQGLDDLDGGLADSTAKPFRCVAFSPDGRRLLAGSKDQHLRMWNCDTGQELSSPFRHSEPPAARPTAKEETETAWISTAFSPNDSWFASAGDDGTIAIWDGNGGEYPISLGGHMGSVLSVAFSPDSQRLASGTYGEVRIWDAAACKQLLAVTGYEGWVNAMAFSPDGKRLAATNGSRAARVCDVRTGKILLQLTGPNDIVNGIAFSPSGDRLALGFADGTVRVYDAASGREAFGFLAHRGPVLGVVFSPSGKRLATASADHCAKTWDVATQRERHALQGHGGYVVGVVFSPDGKRLATASLDGTIRMWDATTGKEFLTLRGHAAAVRALTFSPDGTRLASGSNDRTARLWDTLTGEEVLTLRGHMDQLRSVAFSPDGRCLASGSDDRTVKVWTRFPAFS
jgi:WD40 repeat protein/serine/threonine protein kinase